jgi:VWFA-related protein
MRLHGLAFLWVAAGILYAQEGPKRDVGSTVSRPRKPDAAPAEADTNLPKIPSRLGKKDRPEPGSLPATFKSDVDVVTVDVAVLDNKGHFIPGIPRGNFRVLEDGVPQQVQTFSTTEAPMTVCLVIEFSNLFQRYYSETWNQTLTASYGFLQTLKKDDFVAVVAYDMRSEILSDFSADKNKAMEAMSRLRIAAFSESNLYDALTDTADRMSSIEGRKAIVLFASGRDTFSRLTFDQTRKMLQNAAVPIYAIGLMQTIRELADARGWMNSLTRLDFLQADNQMRTFSKETGGMSFFPRFYGEFPSIFRDISESLRNQYTLGYAPSNKTRDGKFRKITVQLVNPATNEPLPVKDQKGKPIKYSIIAKNGYTAPRAVE